MMTVKQENRNSVPETVNQEQNAHNGPQPDRWLTAN